MELLLISLHETENHSCINSFNSLVTLARSIYPNIDTLVKMSYYQYIIVVV